MPDTPGSQNPSRIAIKFGGPASSSKGKKPSGVVVPSSLGKRQRPHHALDAESESEGEESHANDRGELITSFGVNGAETAGRRKPGSTAPLVIEPQRNRDWRSEAKAQRRGKDSSASRARAQQNESHAEVDTADQDKPLKWGLTMTEKASAEDEEGQNGSPQPQKEKEDSRSENSDKKGPDDARDVEKEAVDALMGKSSASDKRHLVIDGEQDRYNEEDAFRRDFREAANESTLEDYEAMPIDEFGAALLRGMGWDGKDRGPKPKQVKRRPNQLGLGAKELKGSEDLGAWNQKGNQKGSGKPRPPKLHDYRREEEKRREKRDERHRDSYKQERDRERESERSGHRYRDSHRRR